jgi:hypothetical protein
MTEPRQHNGGEIPQPNPNAFNDALGAFAEAASRHAEGPDHQCVELCPICRTADVIRASAPPELREQWNSLQREALTTMRALIDHYLERVDAEPEPQVRVQDIPIE